mgnify:CR=1 FL=1|jgi:hypothetical protein
MKDRRILLEHFSDQYTRRDCEKARPIWAEIAAEFEYMATEYAEKHAGATEVMVCLMDWIAETLEESFGAKKEARDLRQRVVDDLNDALELEEEQRAMRWD